MQSQVHNLRGCIDKCKQCMRKFTKENEIKNYMINRSVSKSLDATRIQIMQVISYLTFLPNLFNLFPQHCTILTVCLGIMPIRNGFQPVHTSAITYGSEPRTKTRALESKLRHDQKVIVKAMLAMITQ